MFFFQYFRILIVISFSIELKSNNTGIRLAPVTTFRMSYRILSNKTVLPASLVPKITKLFLDEIISAKFLIGVSLASSFSSLSISSYLFTILGITKISESDLGAWEAVL